MPGVRSKRPSRHRAPFLEPRRDAERGWYACPHGMGVVSVPRARPGLERLHAHGSIASCVVDRQLLGAAAGGVQVAAVEESTGIHDGLKRRGRFAAAGAAAVTVLPATGPPVDL